MQNSLTPQNALLSALYVIVLFVFLFFLNYGLFWFCNNVAFNVLNWFNHRPLWIKILLLVVGGFSLFMAGMGLAASIPVLLGNIMGRFFPVNTFTIVAAFLLSLANAIWGIIQLWKAAPSYGFWVIIELLLLSYFILALNYSFVPNKSQTEKAGVN